MELEFRCSGGSYTIRMNWIAYIDDSRSDSGIKEYVLAGYLATKDTWKKFEEEWLATLAQSPQIDHFHCVEAYNLRGSFRGWTITERDRKISALAGIVGRHELLSLDCRLSQVAHANILAPVAPFDLRSPYFLLFYTAIATAARLLDAKGYKGSIEYVFDGQGRLGNNTSLWSRSMRASQPAALQSYWTKTPKFEDDEATPGLQAADALAWHLRRGRMPEYSSEIRPVLDLLRGSTHIEASIPDELLHAWAEKFAGVPGINEVRDRKGSVRDIFEAAEQYIGSLPETEQDHAFRQFTNWIEQLAKRNPASQVATNGKQS